MAYKSTVLGLESFPFCWKEETNFLKLFEAFIAWVVLSHLLFLSVV
jgi:hypothetical protein